MKHQILGIFIDDIDDAQFEETLKTWLEKGRQKVIVTPNAELIVKAQKDQALANHLNNSHLALPDAVSLRYAVAALSGQELKHRRTGVDAVRKICHLCTKTQQHVLLLGGEEGSAQKAAEVLGKEIKELDITSLDPGRVHYNNGRVAIADRLIETLEEQDPDIVLVGLGMQKQEAFMHQAKDLLPSVKLWIGVGGAFEMIAGDKPRASTRLQKLGLEWLWRFVIEPSRWQRIIRATVVFPVMIAKQTIKQQRLLKALTSVANQVIKQFRNV